MPVMLLRRLLVGLVWVSIFGLSDARLAHAEGRIVVTIKPIHALVAQVMGSTGSADLLVGGNASPHTYQLKPSDARKIAAADVIFRVSEAVEPFTGKIAALLSKRTELVTLQTAPGIMTLMRREGGPFDSHFHTEAASHSTAHDHADDHDDANSAIDGHVWLDPANAKVMLDEIARVLSKQTPGLAATYQANSVSAKARIDQLSSDIERDLAPVSGRPYVVFHDAYQYFEKRFKLNVVGSITVNPDVPPSGKRLSALRARIMKSRAGCVFGEPNFDAKVIASIIEGTGARSGVLDPEGTSLAAGPDLYEQLMRELATNVKACLARTEP